jgi:hypothetical protein
MKTSILISSITALCLMIAFAEAPRRHGDDNPNISAFDNISIMTVKSMAMLPGVVITAERKKKADISLPDASSEEFGHLRFDVSIYMEEDAANPLDAEAMPEAAETDFSYLKFDVTDYMDADAADSYETEELPEAAENDFSYLKFDVAKYYSSDNLSAFKDAELPEPVK